LERRGGSGGGGGGGGTGGGGGGLVGGAMMIDDAGTEDDLQDEPAGRMVSRPPQSNWWSPMRFHLIGCVVPIWWLSSDR